MVTWADIVAGAAFRADLQDSNRVNAAEWVALANEAINSTWRLAASARPDFQVTFADYVVASGGSASFEVPARRFHGLIDVVFAPDTPGEYSLGPFAWPNRRSPGGWFTAFMYGAGASAPGGSSARLMGTTVFIEPAQRAGGNYRLWYRPRPRTCDFIVRAATSTVLPACTAAGAGVGKTLTANALGALIVDTVTLSLGDRVLVKDQAATADNGIYVMTRVATEVVTWVLTRATDFDATAEILLGDIACATEGLLNGGDFFTLATFTAIEAAQTWTPGAVIDTILDDFVELLKIKAAIPAVIRDEGLQGPLKDEEKDRVAELRAYFSKARIQGPQKIIDTDAMGFGRWGSG